MFDIFHFSSQAEWRNSSGAQQLGENWLVTVT
jgi:hypothetical protein